MDNEERLINLAYNSARKGVATGLLDVQKKYKTTTEPNSRLEISRLNLAQVASTVTESRIKTLSDFRGENLIDIQDGKIQILQEAEWRNLLA